jgi:hypothetical protein
MGLPVTPALVYPDPVGSARDPEAIGDREPLPEAFRYQRGLKTHKTYASPHPIFSR